MGSSFTASSGKGHTLSKNKNQWSKQSKARQNERKTDSGLRNCHPHPGTLGSAKSVPSHGQVLSFPYLAGTFCLPLSPLQFSFPSQKYASVFAIILEEKNVFSLILLLEGWNFLGSLLVPTVSVFSQYTSVSICFF